MSEPEITLRTADETDLGRLSLVGTATFLETYAGTVDGDDIVAHCAVAHAPETYRALLRGPQARAWLAEIAPGGAPVGYALLTAPDLVVAEAGDLEVRRIYVLAPFQGRRVGVRLMNEAVAAAQAAGARRLLLGVYSVNDDAVAFYTRCGFRRIGTRDFVAGRRTYHDLVLARDLD